MKIRRVQKEAYRKNKKGRRPLKWSMILMLLCGWFLPLVLLTAVMIFTVSGRVHQQLEHTITTSMDKAVEICTLRLEDCVTASKNASYMPTIRHSYQTYERTGDHQSLYNEVSLFLAQQYRYNSSFCAAMLVFTQEPEKVYFTYNNTTLATYDNIRYFQNEVSEELLKKTQEIDTATILYAVGGRVYLVRNLVTSSFVPYGVLVLELNDDSIFESMTSVWGYENVQIYNEEEPLAQLDTDQSELDPEQRETLLRSVSNTGKISWSSDDFSVSKAIKTEQGHLVFRVGLDHQQIMTDIWGIYLIFLILMLFMIPLLLMIFSFFHRQITVPLRVLVEASSQIKDGNYGYEISQLADSEEFYYTDEVFNSMSGQLKTQFEKIYLEEIALRDARIMALQSQINPHFLNNTLETINWEARLKGNREVSAMIEALSTMLEATMDRRARSMVRLSEELSYVDAYLFIISRRFGERFQFHREVGEELGNVLVPRLIIQPIVENAVEHGMDIRQRGQVGLRIYTEGQEYLYIEVEDNGTLTEAEQSRIERLLREEPDREQEHHVSLGIRNVDQRLKMIYGAECGLSIHSNAAGHTVSCLILKITR